MTRSKTVFETINMGAINSFNCLKVCRLKTQNTVKREDNKNKKYLEQQEIEKLANLLRLMKKSCSSSLK